MTLPDPPPAAPVVRSGTPPEAPWRRLDPRMLVVQPVREMLRFLPALVALAVAGSASGRLDWQLLGVAVPVALGVLRYLTTSFRITAGRIELQRGLLNRKISATPLDRVRTVDLTASPIHRLVGLTTVRIGTGVGAGDDADGLDLDGLRASEARALRHDLLADAPSGTSASPDEPALEPELPVARFHPSWLRFAPFTGRGLVIAAAGLGLLGQFSQTLGVWDAIGAGSHRFDAAPSVVLVAGLALSALLVVLLLSVLGYLVTNWGFRLTHTPGTWHLRRGLLTTRETSLDEDRIAGVGLGEPLALRAAGGRYLAAIVTGVDRSESGSSTLVPPAPRDVAPAVAAAVLGTPHPMTAPLRPHGPAAARRRWTRALGPALLAPAAAVAVGVAGGPWWLLAPALLVVVLAAGLAADRSAGLGHALVSRHVVTRSGSLTRRREALDTEHVIGWTLHDTWFQRRAGLVTLLATTAGGSGAVTVLDVPEADAVRLVTDALPGLASQFLAHGAGRPL